MWLLWIGIVLIAIVLVLVGFVSYQYARIRKRMPRPGYKPPAHRPQPNTWSDSQVSVAWVGHSTLYINFFGIKIVTDPVFSARIGVKLFGPLIIGPKRHTGPALQPEEVEAADLILLSHAHLDHFDLPSLKRLATEKTRVITAKGTSRLLKNMKFDRVRELGGQERITLIHGMQVTAVPVRHWGARFPWNRDYGWTGYLIEYKGTRLFFAGDTAFTPTFQELQEIDPIDMAMIPIGAYSPDTYQGAHCTPEQAWQMFLDSGAKWLVPIHWDTFVLSQEPVDEPMKRLLAVAGDQSHRIIIREHGETFQLPEMVALT